MFSRNCYLLAIVFLAVLSSPLVAQSHAVRVGTQKDIVDVASRTSSVSTLMNLVHRAGLVKALRGTGPFTVLAPTNKAFEALGEDTLQSFMKPENRGKLAEILKYHVIPGRLLAADAIRAGQATPLLRGGKLNFSIREGSLRVESSRIIANDVLASNGVIHLIDRVLLPPSELLPKPRPTGRKVIGVNLERPGLALASQLNLDRERSSVVTKVTKNGPAAKAGLRLYDVIVSFDDQDGSLKALRRIKQQRDFGDRIRVVVIRRGERQHLRIPIGVEAH